MDLKECAQFASENPVCYIATVDGDQARARGFLMDRADETGFYFIGLTGKDVSAQMHKNPKIEICFYNNPAEIGDSKQMRVTGRVEFLTDAKTTAKAAESRAFLDGITGRPTSSRAEPFKVSHGEAHFWTLPDAGAEKEIDRLTF